jgi:hypothetical protein
MENLEETKKKKKKAHEFDSGEEAAGKEKEMDPNALLALPKLHRYRILVVFYEITELPQRLMDKKNFGISFKLFGVKHKIKLDTSETLPFGINIIPINKLRLFYFFCESTDHFRKFLRTKNVLLLFL